MQADHYIQIVTDKIRDAYASQRTVFSKCAAVIADAIESKHSVFVFGCSHAGILAEELFYRSGGLAIINPIFFPGFMLNTRPITMTSALERVDGVAPILLQQNHVRKGDVLLIHSVTGRNNVPVEMAMCASELGVHTICLTSVESSSRTSSRHKSGKRLFECCEFVLDNCGVPGDAAVEPEGLNQPMGPTSTAVGSALLNALMVETVETLLARGIVPPVFRSANLDGGDEWNQRLFREYGDSIFYM